MCKRSIIAILSMSTAMAAWNARAVNGEWNAAASATYDWTNVNNWASGIVAGGAGFAADIALDITGSSTLTVLPRQEVTVGTLQLGDTGSGTDRPAGIRNFSDYSTVYETFRLSFDGNGADASLTAVGSADKSLRGVTLNSRTVLNNEGGTFYFYGIQTAGASGSTTDSHYNLDAINGSGGLVLQSGTWEFRGRTEFNARNTFSGGFTLEGGAAVTGSGSGGGSAGSPAYGSFGIGRLTFKGGSIGNKQSNGITFANKVTFGGDFSFGTSNAHITFSPGTAADSFVLDAANPTITLGTTDASKINAIDGVVSASPGVPAAGVTFAGSASNGTNSKLNLTGANSNTYTGTTSVTSIQLRLNKSGTAVAIGGDLAIGGHATKNADVFLLGASANQIADTASVAVNSLGSLSLNNKNETIGSLSLATGATVATGTGAGGVLTTTTLTVEGTLKAAGMYTAANLSPFITGNGSVVVLDGPPPGTTLLIR